MEPLAESSFPIHPAVDRDIPCRHHSLKWISPASTSSKLFDSFTDEVDDADVNTPTLQQPRRELFARISVDICAFRLGVKLILANNLTTCLDARSLSREFCWSVARHSASQRVFSVQLARRRSAKPRHRALALSLRLSLLLAQQKVGFGIQSARVRYVPDW